MEEKEHKGEPKEQEIEASVTSSPQTMVQEVGIEREATTQVQHEQMVEPIMEMSKDKDGQQEESDEDKLEDQEQSERTNHWSNESTRPPWR